MSSLQEIMSVHGGDYIRSKRLPSNIIRALSSIQYCKTASLGGHIY